MNSQTFPISCRGMLEVSDRLAILGILDHNICKCGHPLQYSLDEDDFATRSSFPGLVLPGVFAEPSRLRMGKIPHRKWDRGSDAKADF